MILSHSTHIPINRIVTRVEHQLLTNNFSFTWNPNYLVNLSPSPYSRCVLEPDCMYCTLWRVLELEVLLYYTICNFNNRYCAVGYWALKKITVLLNTIIGDMHSMSPKLCSLWWKPVKWRDLWLIWKYLVCLLRAYAMTWTIAERIIHFKQKLPAH